MNRLQTQNWQTRSRTVLSKQTKLHLKQQSAVKVAERRAYAGCKISTVTESLSSCKKTDNLYKALYAYLHASYIHYRPFFQKHWPWNMLRGGQRSYLVRLELLPHQKDLLQLVPPLLGPATHSSPTFTQGLQQKEQKINKEHHENHNVGQISKCSWGIACCMIQEGLVRRTLCCFCLYITDSVCLSTSK